jgi:hypothetical protein
MDETFTPEASTDAVGEVRDAEWYLQSLGQMIEQMRTDRQDIHRLREERQKIQDHTDQVIADTWKIIAKIRGTS